MAITLKQSEATISAESHHWYEQPLYQASNATAYGNQSPEGLAVPLLIIFIINSTIEPLGRGETFIVHELVPMR